MSAEISIDGLPGEEFAAQGLRDLSSGVESIGSLLIEIAASRLRRAGVAVPEIRPAAIDAEFRLYDLLETEDEGMAYSRYTAWLNRLSRFCHAVENRAHFLSHAEPVSRRGYVTS